MAMPKFDETMLPILQVLQDEVPIPLRGIAAILLDKYFHLTEGEKRETVSSGESRFLDRVSWGRTYLKKAGLVEQPARGIVQITEEGKKVLQQGLDRIDVAFLMRYPSFVEFQTPSKKREEGERGELPTSMMSPQDMIDAGFRDVSSTLHSDLRDKLFGVDPYLFEKIVLRLFHKMGYGDFQETPKSGDGGIDGIISQDQLGLEKIYVQAKRYVASNKVREPEIRNFIGAMSGDVSKGIFVTTSSFDEAAIEKAKSAHNHKIILVDGDRLAELMMRHNVGIQTKSDYEIKEIDDDFFEGV